MTSLLQMIQELQIQLNSIKSLTTTGTLTAPLSDQGGEKYNVKAYGALGDGVTDDYTAILAAETASGAASPIFFPTGTYKIGTSITLPDVIMMAGAMLSPNFGVTVTISSTLDAPRKQIFTGAGKVAIPNGEVYTSWWGDKTVSVPAPALVPTLALGTYGFASPVWTTGSTYNFAYTYEGWTGESQISPATTFTVDYNEGFVVLPVAVLNTGAVAARIYVQKNGGGYKLIRSSGGAGVGARCGFGDETIFGGVWITNPDDANAPLTAPPGANTAVTSTGAAIANPTVAPTVTKIAHLPPSTTLYGAYSYTCQDGTETALSPVAGPVTTAAAGTPQYITFVLQPPPSGAVFTNFYLGTVSTSLHLQLAHQPLHYASRDVHSYDAAGAAHTTGASQSTISALQQAIDVAVQANAGRTIFLQPGPQSVTYVPIIMHDGGVGTHLMGLGGHTDPGGGQSRSQVAYNGTLTDVELVVFYGSAWLVENIDFHDYYTKSKYGIAFCDFTGGQAFNSRFVNCTFGGFAPGGGYGLIVDPRSTAGITSHTASEMYFELCSFWGTKWAIHISGGQSGDFRFQDITTNVASGFASPAVTANSGEIRIMASSGDYIRGWNVNGNGQYGLYITTEGAHPSATNFLSMEVSTLLFEAQTTACVFYVSGSVNHPAYVSISNSTINSFNGVNTLLGAYGGGLAHFTYQNNQLVDWDALLVHPDATLIELGGLSGLDLVSGKYKAVSPSQATAPIKIRNGPLHLNGQNLYMVTGVPSNSLGSNGDIAFRADGVAGAAQYQKRSGAWASDSTFTPVVADFTTAGASSSTVPVGCTTVSIYAVGAGGGGGSGRRGAAGTVRGGGGGGASGGVTQVMYSAADLGGGGTGLTVTVGTGGTGNAGKTVDSTDGAAGGTGGDTQVIVVAGSRGLAYASGSSGGGGGTTSGGAGGTNGGFGSVATGSNGAAGGTGAAGGIASNANPNEPGPGGGGGGISSGDTHFDGGAGGTSYRPPLLGITAGAAGTAGGGAGGIAVAVAGSPGPGAGGGGANTAGAGGNGGAGIRGGGGGGGGASVNGNTSGAGGNGGDGWVRIIYA